MSYRTGDIWLEMEARTILNNFQLDESDKESIVEEWSKEVFELHPVVYRNGKKAILEGRASALAALQTLCTNFIMQKYGVKRAPRPQLNKG